MFTIQYVNGVRIWDVPKRKLFSYIITAEHDIADVYEQATPVTKRVRAELIALGPDHTTPAARRFMFPA